MSTAQPPQEPAPDDPALQQPEASPTEATASSGWRRLLRMGRPRPTKANLLATALAGLLGFAMVTQVQQNRASGLENLSQGDLVALLDGVQQQSLKLDEEADKLTRTRDSLRSSSGDQAALTAADERLKTLGILAGTLAATGPGIKITITDSAGAVQPANLLEAVEELRDAGAEAIQINNVRVVASTWFGTSSAGVMQVDGREIVPPYEISAIGDSHTMATAMAIPGGVVETIKQLNASATVRSVETVTVDALRPATAPSYARPNASAS